MLTALQVALAAWLVAFLALCAIGVIALIVGAIWMYHDAQMRGMDAIVWVILLILATIFGTIIGFAIVFVIYLVVRENHPVGGHMPYGYGYGYGPGYAPGYAPPATPPQSPQAAGPAPTQTATTPAACPVCGSPMMWYPQYQRWYCATCATYR